MVFLDLPFIQIVTQHPNFVNTYQLVLKYASKVLMNKSFYFTHYNLQEIWMRNLLQAEYYVFKKCYGDIQIL